MPAQQITPPSERWVVFEIQEIVALTALEIESEEVTSVSLKSVRSEAVKAGVVEVADESGGFKSRIETFAPARRREMAVARPRPDDLAAVSLVRFTL